MVQAKLTCSRCSQRHPAARMAWVTAVGWCCRVHSGEATREILVDFFSWCLARPPHGRPSPILEMERHALDIVEQAIDDDPEAWDVLKDTLAEIEATDYGDRE